MPDIRYPQTARIDVVEKHFGHDVIDPCRWLEADPAQDGNVADWIAAQNAVTADYLENLPGRSILRGRMAELCNYPRYSGPPIKYVAALQASELGARPHLARIETRAGHGGGMPLDKRIDQHADMWAFAAWWTGLSIKPLD